MATEHIVHLEAPETPDLLPQIAAMRERLATLEERSSAPSASDPVAAESLALASEAHHLAAGLEDRVKALESASLAQAESVESEVSSEVQSVIPPAALESPTPEEPSSEQGESHEHHSWWNPMRYL